MHYRPLGRTGIRVSPFALGAMMFSSFGNRDQDSDLRRTRLFAALRDERRIDAVEELIPLAEEAGLPLTHLALAFVIAHPGVTSALVDPRTMEQHRDPHASSSADRGAVSGVASLALNLLKCRKPPEFRGLSGVV